jgi:catechol 2,3-dioxygenase-like lactoylglutathione lyase family enzyme
MTISVLGIDHVVIRVADVDRSIRFYGEVLGCPVERRRDDIGLIQLRAGRSLVDLIDIDSELGRMGGAAPGADAHNMDHFALRIESFDEDALRRHLAEHGIEAGDVNLGYGAEGDGPSFYIQDPDGNTVELKGPAAD